MIRTVICDDHPLINQGLQSYLAMHKQIQVVASASTALELRRILAETPADVLLLDIQLPDGNGLELCAEIRKSYPGIRIMGLSNIDDRGVILNMLHQGASGYLLKSAPMEDIENAILHIHDGGVYLGKEVQMSLNTQKYTSPPEIPAVTRREKEVLHYLSRGFSSAQIAEAMFVSPLTVDTHRRNLLQKFNVNKTVNLLQKAKEAGLLEI